MCFIYFILSYVLWSIFTVPYLFLLGHIIKVREVYSVGAVIAVVSIIFLWILVAVFKQIGKKRKLAALGIAFLSAIPFTSQFPQGLLQQQLDRVHVYVAKRLPDVSVAYNLAGDLSQERVAG